MNSTTDPLSILHRYWGYASFRPFQERIIRSLLAGRDACVVMPTGGGKSVCYQLPAAMSSNQTAVVISPLIALMQDQVAQLSQMGVEAAVLNSSQPAKQQSLTIENAVKGRFRLLYLSPERLARAGAIQWLHCVPISFFAIDEAHCISEWGHEFRPEYRQLSRLRTQFPNLPIAAFTASATQRVRHDIIDQLRLREPDKCIASFHRVNLRYVVKQCEGQTQPDLLLRAVRTYTEGNVIVYAPTIRRVEETVDLLEENGVSAIAYHGKMDAQTRKRNQERWMSDEIRVLVGTLAFGLGINKAAVRAVIHLSLTKSVEQYYQEAGRAGRDGNASDCVLLWQKQDVVLLKHFIKEVGDEAERARSLQRLNEILRFVDSKTCRHRQICLHFGETPKWTSCRTCDACGYLPEWLLAPVEQKQPEPRKSRQASANGVDAELSDYLREWRRTTAKKQGVPAFVVMHDTSLEDLCRVQPRSLSELRRVPGFGERKTASYGEEILAALGRFRAGARAAQAAGQLSSPARETTRLLAEGRTFEEVAKIRGRQVSTIVSLAAGLIEKQQLRFQPAWIDSTTLEKIRTACAKLGLDRLRPLKEALPEETTYDEIRLVVAHLRSQEKRPSTLAASAS